MSFLIDCQPVVFLFSDTQIVHESFLEDINNLLNSGEVPSLFEPDELEEIVAKVRPLCKAAGKVDTQGNVMAHFVQLVRENLHIVLAFSPIGALLEVLLVSTTSRGKHSICVRDWAKHSMGPWGSIPFAYETETG